MFTDRIHDLHQNKTKDMSGNFGPKLSLGLWSLLFAFGGMITPAQASENSGLPQLDISTYPSQIFWLLVSFTVLYLGMSKIIIPNISEVLQDRQERISNDFELAKTLAADSDDIQNQINKETQAVNTEARTLIAKAQNDGKAMLSAKEAELAAESRKVLEKTESQALEAKQTYLSSMNEVAADLAHEIIMQVSGKNLDKKLIQAELVEARTRNIRVA